MFSVLEEVLQHFKIYWEYKTIFCFWDVCFIGLALSADRRQRETSHKVWKHKENFGQKYL